MNAVSSSLVAVTAFGMTTAASLRLVRAGLVGGWRLCFVAGGVAGGIVGTRSARHLSERRGGAQHCVRGGHYCGWRFICWRVTFPCPSRKWNSRSRRIRYDQSELSATSGHTRRQALGPARRGRGMLGAGGAPRSALAADGEDNVLNEALVLRDPEIPVIGKRQWRHHHRRMVRLQLPLLPQARARASTGVQDDGKVRLVLKDWPILGPVSRWRRGWRWPPNIRTSSARRHDAMMGVSSRFDRAAHRRIAGGAGIDMDRLKADLASNAKAIDAILARNNDQAEASVSAAHRRSSSANISRAWCPDHGPSSNRSSPTHARQR